jgi:hypothetical protein
MRLVMVFVLLIGAAFAQNADVVRMLQGGVPESAIVSSILTMAHQGVQFDVSPAALVELRRAGATERVLQAMMTAQSEIAPGIDRPKPKGVFTDVTGGVAALSPFVLWSPIVPRTVAWPMDRRRRPEFPLDESTPILPIKSSTPSLAVQGFSSMSGWQLVQLNGKTLRLRRKNAYSSDFMSNEVFEKADTKAVVVNGSAGSFTVQPAAPLSPGAYVLCNQIQEQGWARICYPFSVAGQ